MQHCWRHDPALRPTFDRICEEISFIIFDVENATEANKDTLLKFEDEGIMLSSPSSQQFLSMSSAQSYYGSVSNDGPAEGRQSEAKNNNELQFVCNEHGEDTSSAYEDTKSEVSI